MLYRCVARHPLDLLLWHYFKAIACYKRWQYSIWSNSKRVTSNKLHLTPLSCFKANSVEGMAICHASNANRNQRLLLFISLDALWCRCSMIIFWMKDIGLLHENFHYKTHWSGTRFLPNSYKPMYGVHYFKGSWPLNNLNWIQCIRYISAILAKSFHPKLYSAPKVTFVRQTPNGTITVSVVSSILCVKVGVSMNAMSTEMSARYIFCLDTLKHTRLFELSRREDPVRGFWQLEEVFETVQPARHRCSRCC